MGTLRICPAQITIAYEGTIINLDRWVLMEDWVLSSTHVRREDALAARALAEEDWDAYAKQYLTSERQPEPSTERNGWCIPCQEGEHDSCGFDDKDDCTCLCGPVDASKGADASKPVEQEESDA